MAIARRSSTVVADLFTEPSRHDPGGKVASPLPKGMLGHAEFYGDRDQYRLWLSRVWGKDSKFVLWVGMNPSTATADVNDPTVTREINFTKDWGYSKYIKCNVMDYRATNQSDLTKPGVAPRSHRNLDTIVSFARDADQIIICYGVLPKSLQMYAQDVVASLQGRQLLCLGRTLFGHPRHPLYLRSDTKPEPFV